MRFLLRRRRMRVARRYGMENVRTIFNAANDAHVPLHIALALFEQESPDPERNVRGGANVYGHDAGGTFSTRDGGVTACGTYYPQHAYVPVTPANAAVFLIRVAAGAPSNGMGLGQVTYADDLPDGRSGGLFRLMLEDGLLPWDPYDNAVFSLKRLRADYDRETGSEDHRWRLAFGHYNGGTRPDLDYAGQAMTKATLWEARLP